MGAGALARDILAVVGGSTNGVWYTQVLTIITAVLSIPVSQAADLWGRKVFLVSLSALGAVGSVVVSRSEGGSSALAGFSILGIANSSQPLLHAIVSEVLARKYRPWAQASINFSAALGAITGLVVGGALTTNNKHDGFRIYWYVVAGIYTLTAVSCQLLYNTPPRSLQVELSMRQKLRQLDWVGYALLCPALVLFCMSLSWSQNPFPWSDGHVSAPFTIGVFLTIVLIIFETFIKKDGMFHHELFRHRNFPLALGCIFTEGIVFFSANNYFAFETSILFPTTDSLMIGVHYSIAFIAFGISSIATGLWCSKSRTIKIPCVVSFGFFVIFFILMATVSISTTERQFWAYPIFIGIGLGICLTTLVTAAQFATPRELIAITSGLMISIRALGGSVGLAIYQAIFTHEISSNLGPKVAKAVLPLDFPASSLSQFIPALINHDDAALKSIPGVTPDVIQAGVGAVMQTFVIAFRYVWVTAGCISFVAMIGESI